jgi:hypothetical protein
LIFSVGFMCLPLKACRYSTGFKLFQHPEIRQIPVPAGMVQAIAHHEFIRDGKAEIINRNADDLACRLKKQRGQFQARGFVRL